MRLETLDALLDGNTDRKILSETVRDAIALARDNLEDAAAGSAGFARCTT